MAVARAQTVDVAQVLADLMGDIDGLRVHTHVSDATRPPAAVIGQPEIDFADAQAAFCAATWNFPVTVITSRANDREAQKEMSRLLLDIVTALGADVPGVFSIEPLDARPVTVAVSGQDLPAYLLNIRVKA